MIYIVYWIYFLKKLMKLNMIDYIHHYSNNLLHYLCHKAFIIKIMKQM